MGCCTFSPVSALKNFSKYFKSLIKNNKTKPNIYGVCKECHKPNSGPGWCHSCNACHFKEEFKIWTSGDQNIDAAIRDAQLTATLESNVVEWIPYNRFTDITKIGEGGYGTVCRAHWLDGRILGWDAECRTWKRVGAHVVALKTFHKSQNISTILLNELVGLQKSCGGTEFTGIIRIYGVSQNPNSEEYILVLDYARDGNLHSYIHKNIYKFSWSRRMDTLYQIAIGLRQLHNKGLLHGDFHGGNIVCGSGYVLVTDLGLCRPSDDLIYSNEKEVYGVIPYVAPEVFYGKPYSKASDVYSFGILMHEIATCQLPFASVPHDAELITQILNGKRPQIPHNVPSFYTQLMKRCWDVNPLVRPNVNDITHIIYKWLYKPTSNVSLELKLSEENRPRAFESEETYTHPQAVYTSRLLLTKSSL